jgi:hypothetical protein
VIGYQEVTIFALALLGWDLDTGIQFFFHDFFRKKVEEKLGSDHLNYVSLPSAFKTASQFFTSRHYTD